MYKISIFYFFIISFIILINSTLFAQEKTFIREYTYRASDYDSKVTSRTNALEELKLLLLEEVAVFIKREVISTQNETLIKDNEDIKETYSKKIVVLTAGITRIVVLDEKWTGYEYWIKAEITIDENDINKKIKKIINNEKYIKDLQVANAEAEAARKEIGELKKDKRNRMG